VRLWGFGDQQEVLNDATGVGAAPAAYPAPPGERERMTSLPRDTGATAERPSGRVPAPAFISDQDLIERYVTPPMMRYFRVKLPGIGAELLSRRICELIKYLMLIQFSPGRILFGRETDDVWHYWILQTKQYSELCAKLPGGFFRHHSSADYPESDDAPTPPDIAAAVERMLSFFISYYRNFGPMTADRAACWPTLRQIMEEAGWDIDQLNDFLSERALAPVADERESAVVA
jgi:hypothetical protein